MIDTVVYRGGDMLSSWLVSSLRGIGLGLSALSFIAVPLALAWCAIAVWLGRHYQALSNGGAKCVIAGRSSSTHRTSD